MKRSECKCARKSLLKCSGRFCFFFPLLPLTHIGKHTHYEIPAPPRSHNESQQMRVWGVMFLEGDINRKQLLEASAAGITGAK